MNVEDEIHLDPFTTGVGNRNLPPSRRQGVELESSLAGRERRSSCSAGYAYTDARYLEGVLRVFLLCLVIPVRRLRPLIIIVTAFTAGHSISLIASAAGFVPDALWFPPLIETLIAVTIVYMALENIVYAALGQNDLSRRWIIAFAFGIVHGFGFSFALRELLQFAGDHLVTALAFFNIGVEIGQIAVLIVLVPALSLLFRYVVPERIGIIILSALVAHTGWHWMLERGAELAKFPFPKIDAAFVASVMRGLMAMLILAGAVMLANGLLRRWIRADKIATAGARGGNWVSADPDMRFNRNLGRSL